MQMFKYGRFYNMKIKYRIEDKIIIEAESHPTHILIADIGEIVEEYSGQEKPLSGMVREGVNQIRVRTKKEFDDEKESKKTNGQKRLEELRKKTSILSIEEINEVLKLNGIL